MMNNHKTIIEKANAAIVAGDNEGFLKFCTEDTTWTFVGDKVLRGKETVRQWMATAYKKPPNFDLLHLIAEGDYVTAVGNIKLRDENFKMIDHKYCDVWRFENGLIAELTAFVIAV